MGRSGREGSIDVQGRGGDLQRIERGELREGCAETFLWEL